MLGCVTIGNPHWYSYLMPRWCWQTIRPDLLEYRDRFLADKPYANRPHDAIVAWIKEKFQGFAYPEGPRIVPSSLYANWHLGTWYWVSSQDAVTAAAVYSRGLVKLFTYVNRCVNVGKHGVHFSPELYRTNKLDQVNQDVFDEDAGLADFTFCQFDGPPE